MTHNPIRYAIFASGPQRWVKRTFPTKEAARHEYPSDMTHVLCKVQRNAEGTITVLAKEVK